MAEAIEITGQKDDLVLIKRDAATAAAVGVYIEGNQVLGPQQSNVPDLVITWTANEPTAGDTQTIADGTTPTVAELGQAVKNLNTKISAIITVLEAHGLSA